MTKFLLHQTNQNGLSHVIRPQGVYLLVPTLWLNSVKLKGVSSLFITKHTKTNDKSTSLSLTQHNSYFVKNKIIILFFLFFLLILLAIDKCNRASSLAISVSQHCERAFRSFSQKWSRDFSNAAARAFVAGAPPESLGLGRFELHRAVCVYFCGYGFCHGGNQSRGEAVVSKCG